MALGPIVGCRDWTYLVSIRPNSWPVEPRDIDARDRFCSRIPAFASARAHRGGRRDHACRNGGALGPLRHRGVLRDDRRRDRRLLVNAHGKSAESDMTARSTRILVMAAAFLAGLVLCFGVVLIVTGRLSSPVAQQIAAIGGPFKLTDQNEQMVTDQDLKGRPFLVFFGFTHCPDVCPTTLFEVSEILRALGPGADRTRALFITVDPERDTPAVIKDYLSSFDPHLSGLTGDPAAIAAAAKAYRVYFKKVPLDEGGYTMDHTAIVYLMDKVGRFVSPFNLKRTIDAAAADLRRYL